TEAEAQSATATEAAVPNVTAEAVPRTARAVAERPSGMAEGASAWAEEPSGWVEVVMLAREGAARCQEGCGAALPLRRRLGPLRRARRRAVAIPSCRDPKPPCRRR